MFRVKTWKMHKGTFFALKIINKLTEMLDVIQRWSANVMFGVQTMERNSYKLVTVLTYFMFIELVLVFKCVLKYELEW